MSSRSESPRPNTDRILLDLLEGIAEVREEDLIELPPLGDLLDYDALEQFLTSTNVPTTVTLEVYECRVQIDGDGTVSVTGPDEEDQ